MVLLGNLTLTLMFSLAEVSKNSRPSESASCFPRSKLMTRSSSMSHLLPTRITCALSQEYVLIWVHLSRGVKGANYNGRLNFSSPTFLSCSLVYLAIITEGNSHGNNEPLVLTPRSRSRPP